MHIHISNSELPIKIFKISLIFIFSIITGCATNTIPPSRSIKEVNFPQLNTENSQELGNTLLQYYYVTTLQTIEILEFWSIRKEWNKNPPQILIPINTTDKLSKFRITKGNGGSGIEVCYDSLNSTFSNPNGYNMCDYLISNLSNSGYVAVRPAEYEDVSRPYTKQELIYNGRVGNNIKFLYREISGNTMRAPFTQEIQYDLLEGSIVGFKGARIEIISSTNSIIKYKVLKMFDKLN
jgi:hypothetical protein